MNTPSSFTHDRALVLGGGGAAGNAWLIGVLAGSADNGLDTGHADLIIGTSAGATAAAQLTAASPADLFSDILGSAPVQRVGQAMGRPGEHLERLTRTIAASDDLMDLRRRMGAVGRELAAVGDPGRWRSIVEARLPGAHWPEHRMVLTAVDADSAEAVQLDGDSGVDVVDAVAASTSGAAAYPIGDRWYIDGGYRRNADNADLAIGSARVLVLSPLGGRSLHPVEWRTDLAAQVEELHASGSEVESVLPDGDALTAFGDNMMDLSVRVPAARAGYAQGAAEAGRLREWWG